MIITTALYKKSISKIPVLIPTQNGSLTYTGGVQYPSWIGFNDNIMEISGQASGIDAENYTAVFALKDKKQYQWEDGTQGNKNVSWGIGRAIITTGVPYQDGELTYTGNVLTPTWANYDPSKLEIGGTTSETNVGTYEVTFTPTKNYQWGKE